MASHSETMNAGGPDLSMSISQCPVTTRRIPAVDADRHVEKPGVARANIAASTTAPQGYNEHTRRFQDRTVLQQHVLFWDRDNDGMIYPWNTYNGFRDLGFNIIFSCLAMLIINLSFSYPTRLNYSYLPDPFFRVYVDGIHKAKHGSDTETYDNEGRFRPQMFEDMFAKWDSDGDGSLTFQELFNMIKGNRNAVDPYGWFAAFFEFGTTWLLIQKNGKVSKEDLRQVYDGSIFWRIRDERQREKGWNQGFGLGGDGFMGGQKVSAVPTSDVSKLQGDV